MFKTTLSLSMFLSLLAFSVNAQDFQDCNKELDKMGVSTGFSLPVEYFAGHPACDEAVNVLIFRDYSGDVYSTFYRVNYQSSDTNTGDYCQYVSSKIGQRTQEEGVYRPINWCEVDDEGRFRWDLSNVLIHKPISLM